jgi:SAM-dependent methyltransferase
MTSPHGHQHDHPGDAGDAALAEVLDLDAEVVPDYLPEVTRWLHELAADPPRRILDLGTGTGTGALALAREFPAAEVTAVDVSEPMLHRLADKARGLGLADRIRPVRADLDAGWPAVGPADLVWASTSLHHLADPERTLAEIFAGIAPGGLLAVAEMDSLPRFLPDDLGIGRPGLEERCRALVREAMAEHLPHLGADWGPRLVKAGFADRAQRRFDIDLRSPLPAAAGRYALVSLRRMRSRVEGALDADDLATWDTLLADEGPGSVLRRGDLNIRHTRTVWVAERP